MGKVIFIGAGPGNPELLTVGALRSIQHADVVLYDALVSREVMELIQPLTECVFVGKRAFRHHKNQSEINDMLIRHAMLHDKVVRLKGGDTAIYARLAEEIQALKSHGIEFEIKAGVTACSGAAAALGFSLTNRKYGSEFLMTTASSYQDPDACQAIAILLNRNSAVSVYMPLVGGECIIQNLIKAGAFPDHPIVVVVNATLANQRLSRSTLRNVDTSIIRRFSCGDPVILLVGNLFQRNSEIDHIPPVWMVQTIENGSANNQLFEKMRL